MVFNNGIIICFQSAYVVPSTETDKQIYFPISYTTKPAITYLVSNTDSVGSPSLNRFPYIVTSTYFTVSPYDNHLNSWISIGY